MFSGFRIDKKGKGDVLGCCLWVCFFECGYPVFVVGCPCVVVGFFDGVFEVLDGLRQLSLTDFLLCYGWILMYFRYFFLSFCDVHGKDAAKKVYLHKSREVKAEWRARFQRETQHKRSNPWFDWKRAFILLLHTAIRICITLHFLSIIGITSWLAWEMVGFPIKFATWRIRWRALLPLVSTITRKVPPPTPLLAYQALPVVIRNTVCEVRGLLSVNRYADLQRVLGVRGSLRWHVSWRALLLFVPGLELCQLFLLCKICLAREVLNLCE